MTGRGRKSNRVKCASRLTGSPELAGRGEDPVQLRLGVAAAQVEVPVNREVMWRRGWVSDESSQMILLAFLGMARALW